MTQEGQALPSPTPPESPVEPNTATADPPTETHSRAEQGKLGARANDEIEEGKTQEGIREGKEEAQWESHGEGQGREGVTAERGEGELKEETQDGTSEENQTEGRVKGKSGEGCRNVEVSSVGEKAAREGEGMKEEEKGKENDEMQLSAEDSPQAERLVH